MSNPTRPGRRLALRMLSLVSALALVLAGTADAYGLHRCAHHDALPGAAAEAGSGHGEHHAGGHDQGAPSSDSHDAGCTCVGDCAGSPGIESPADPAELDIQPTTTARGGSPVPHDAPRVAHPPHALPFAHGPPLDR